MGFSRLVRGCTHLSPGGWGSSAPPHVIRRRKGADHQAQDADTKMPPDEVAADYGDFEADCDLADGFDGDAAADAHDEAQAKAEAYQRAEAALRGVVFGSELERLIAVQLLADEIVQDMLGGDSEDSPDGIVWHADTSRRERAWAARPLRWPRARRQEPRSVQLRRRVVRSASRARQTAGRRSRCGSRAGPARQDDSDPEPPSVASRRRSPLGGRR